MTPTPRTDALVQGGVIAHNLLEHAREMEREVARLHAVIRSEWPQDQAEEIINNCMDATKRGDEMTDNWKERAEKAEAIIKQLHHYAGIIEGFQNTKK